ncbi:MAG: hypothetical protein PHH08_03675 [Candidatus ainarchaeum sp.]|nr:hypothetical protein [Candidatus ainarchaeum sp.]
MQELQKKHTIAIRTQTYSGPDRRRQPDRREEPEVTLISRSRGTLREKRGLPIGKTIFFDPTKKGYSQSRRSEKERRKKQ